MSETSDHRLRAASLSGMICSIVGAVTLAALIVFGGKDPLAEDRYVRMIFILTFGCLFCCVGVVLGMVGAMKSRYRVLGILALVIGLISPMILLGISFAYTGL
jgi:hypothetical protein